MGIELELTISRQATMHTGVMCPRRALFASMSTETETETIEVSKLISLHDQCHHCYKYEFFVQTGDR